MIKGAIIFYREGEPSVCDGRSAIFLIPPLHTVICLIRAPGAAARSNLGKSWGSQLFNSGFGLKIGQLLKKLCLFWLFMIALGSSKLRGALLRGGALNWQNTVRKKNWSPPLPMGKNFGPPPFGLMKPKVPEIFGEFLVHDFLINQNSSICILFCLAQCTHNSISVIVWWDARIY